MSENGQNIYKKVNATDFWIGGSDLLITSNWTWTDGTIWSYTSWANDEPNNNPGSDCVSSRLSDGLWIASNCFKRKPFICQIPPLPVVKCPNFCDSEWAFFNESDSCYKTFYNLKWNDAEATCVENGAHLASIHSDAENSFVAGEFSDERTHLRTAIVVEHFANCFFFQLWHEQVCHNQLLINHGLDFSPTLEILCGIGQICHQWIFTIGRHHNQIIQEVKIVFNCILMFLNGHLKKNGMKNFKIMIVIIKFEHLFVKNHQTKCNFL